MAKFCVNCGTPLPDGAGFCPKCGAKVEVPHCPSCGKEVDFETEYCIYCGARLKEEPIPESKPVTEPIQSKEIPVATPEEDAGLKENNGNTFSWTYRRAYRRKHSFAARVDNDYLLIAESERNAITTEIPLHAIQSIVLEAKASAFRWIMLAFIISLPPITMVIGRDILAIRSVSELLVAVLIIVVFTAAHMWSNWFYLSHYCLTIIWQENEKKRYAFLKDKKVNTLEQVQAVLTQATGIAPQSKKSNTVKIGVSIILGIALSVAVIFLLQSKQSAGEDITVKESGTPSPLPSISVEHTSPDPVADESETPTDDDRSTWEYDDYVKYYGFDPADYGYVWYNSMRSGPLEDFFAWVDEEINGGTNISRLYEISNPWEAELTPDDFVGTWETDGGIIFYVGNTDGNYTIDLTESGLGLLGGGFNQYLYNIEDQFCGMSGTYGGTSFSISYGYGTDESTSTWLELVVVNSDGTEIRDYVSLYPSKGYDLSELLGDWVDTVYEKPAPAFLNISVDDTDQGVYVTYTVPMSDELHGRLKMDEDGDLYVDMVSIYGDNNNPSFRLYLFYDGTGISCLQNYINGEQYTPYFERF